MIHAGLGECQVNPLLSAVNLPNVHHKSPAMSKVRDFYLMPILHFVLQCSGWDIGHVSGTFNLFMM